MAVRNIDPGWSGMDGTFGGYVLAAAVDGVALPGYRPQSVTLAFISTVHPGEVDVRVEPLHRGRSTASVRVELHQGGRLRAHGLGSLVRAEPADETTPRWEPPPAPVRPGPDDVTAYEPTFGRLPYLDQLDLRGVGEDSLDDGATAWVRVKGHVADDLSPHAVLALYLDVMPPGVFSADPPPTFVPSLELTAHYSPRASSATPGSWCSVNNRTSWVAPGYCVDECELRDREGHVVAQLRQGRQVRW
jgi:acyl-CoA thioesterase